MKYVKNDISFFESKQKDYIIQCTLQVKEVANGIINLFGNSFPCGVYVSAAPIDISLDVNKPDDLPHYNHAAEVKIDDLVLYIGSFRTNHYGNIFVDFLSRYGIM